MANETILSSPLFLNIILPFVLIFTVVFALLQKTSILGKDKRQIDALVALVVGLIVVAFGNAVDVINSLMPFLAVSVIVILVFLILYSMVFQGEDKFHLPKGLKIGIAIAVGIAVVVAVLLVTGAWDYILYEWIYAGDGGAITTNILFVVIVIAAIAMVLIPFGRKKE